MIGRAGGGPGGLALGACRSHLQASAGLEQPVAPVAARHTRGRAMAGCCAALAAFLFEYDTPRIVLIRSRKVGLMNRTVQLFILAYVIG